MTSGRGPSLPATRSSSSAASTASRWRVWSVVDGTRASYFQSLARPERSCYLGYAAVLPDFRGAGVGVAVTEAAFAWAGRGRVHVDGHRLARDEPTCLSLLAAPRVPHDVPAAVPPHPVTRVPMLAGSRLVVVTADDDAVVLRPPAPAGGVADVGAAVRDALRFPLAGQPLEALVTRGARATVVVEPPQLPLPGTERDPRQAAIAAAVAELERLGIPTGYQTLLVAGGLARRAGHDLLETLVSPEFARHFHGHVEVHDVETRRPRRDRHGRLDSTAGSSRAREHRCRRRRHRSRDGAARRAGRARRRVGTRGAARGRGVLAARDVRVAGLAARTGARARARAARARHRGLARPEPSALSAGHSAATPTSPSHSTASCARRFATCSGCFPGACAPTC